MKIRYSIIIGLLFILISCSSKDNDDNFIDSDNDGIEDTIDNCPDIANPNQEDTDNDGSGDVCDDSDNDGVIDTIDNCPDIANPNQEDTDNDGIGDVCDINTSANKIPCENGFAGIYPCNDYDLLTHINLTTLDADSANDSWGWTDDTTGNEYAIIGLDNGTAFVDITNEPIYLGKLPTATENSLWRDIKVYNNHAFIVTDVGFSGASDHGMQIFDLTKLRMVNNPPEIFTADTRVTDFGKCHNMVINEDSGYGYPVGTDTNNGGPLFINIQNPKNPIIEGAWSLDYCHDAQVVTYSGPDTDYTGKEILIGSNLDQLVILDVTNKTTPITIATMIYENIGATHQGWFTEDQRYFLLGDENDETTYGIPTRTLVFDFTDLDNPQQHFSYSGPTDAIDHNGYVKGNTFYLANYAAGVRFIDISNISDGSMNEIGYFDTYPENDGANSDGVWNVYPFFDSGKIVISDINSGLFIVKKSD